MIKQKEKDFSKKLSDLKKYAFNTQAQEKIQHNSSINKIKEEKDFIIDNLIKERDEAVSNLKTQTDKYKQLKAKSKEINN
jgi:hypothetical protein